MPIRGVAFLVCLAGAVWSSAFAWQCPEAWYQHVDAGCTPKPRLCGCSAWPGCATDCVPTGGVYSDCNVSVWKVQVLGGTHHAPANGGLYDCLHAVQYYICDCPYSTCWYWPCFSQGTCPGTTPPNCYGPFGCGGSPAYLDFCG